MRVFNNALENTKVIIKLSGHFNNLARIYNLLEIMKKNSLSFIEFSSFITEYKKLLKDEQLRKDFYIGMGEVFDVLLLKELVLDNINFVTLYNYDKYYRDFFLKFLSDKFVLFSYRDSFTDYVYNFYHYSLYEKNVFYPYIDYMDNFITLLKDKYPLIPIYIGGKFDLNKALDLMKRVDLLFFELYERDLADFNSLKNSIVSIANLNKQLTKEFQPY